MNNLELAEGHDNVANLKVIWELNPFYLQDLIGVDIFNGWHNSEVVRTNSELVDVEQGPPWDEWLIPFLTPADAYYLNSLGPLMTIRTLNKSENRMANYNCTKSNPILTPELWDEGNWDPLTYTFKLLEEIV